MSRPSKRDAKATVAFTEYAKAVQDAPSSLEFVLEHCGSPIVADMSVESLEKAESAYWRAVETSEFGGVIDEPAFARLCSQYFVACALHNADVELVQSHQNNSSCGEPMVRPLKGEEWDCVFPTDLAAHLLELVRTKPFFLGVQKRRVWAAHLERLIQISPK